MNFVRLAFLVGMYSQVIDVGLSEYTDDLPAPAINLASVASDLKIIVPLSTSTPQVGQEFAPEMSTAQVPPISRWALSPERLNTVDAREAVADGAEETATKRSHPHLRADRPEVQLDGCSRGLALGSSSAIHTRTGNRPFAGHVAIKRESPTSSSSTRIFSFIRCLIRAARVAVYRHP
jgi:hypothetical protein